MDNKIIQLRASDNSIVKLECYDKVDSVRDIALERATVDGCSDRYAVVAECDEASGEGRGVYMSLILRPSIFPSQAGLLAPLAAVAAVTALDEYTDSHLGIGWVSNIYSRGRQIGSVTIEGKLNSYMAYEYLIVSFLIRLPEREFPPRLSDMIKKVFESDARSVYTIIARSVLSKFFSLYHSLKRPEKFMKTYADRFILTGVRAKRIKGGKKIPCRILNVDINNCALKIETREDGFVNVTSPTSMIIPKRVRLPRVKRHAAAEAKRAAADKAEAGAPTQARVPQGK